jgi:hypothetical protein
MKYAILSTVMLFLLGSCNSQQTEAKKQAAAIKNAIAQTRPGTVATKEGSWTMIATINGKKWIAGSIMPPEAAGRIIGYYDEEYIGLPYDKRNMVVGKKITFREGNAVDLSTSDDIGLWGGRKGEMEITKVNGDWVEGTFYFTGSTSQSDKTIEVTDGFFRIQVKSF